MIKKLAAVILVLAVAAPAMANVIPASAHYYVWKELSVDDGDQLDAFMEVERGDFIELQILANSYQGTPANIDMTVTWDPNALNVSNHVSNGWHWAVYAYNWDWSGADQANGLFHVTSAVDSWHLNEGEAVMGWDVSIDANAPLGLHTLGLVMSAPTSVNIPAGDAFAMTFNVVPEPMTMSLLAMGGLAMIRKRRK